MRLSMAGCKPGIRCFVSRLCDGTIGSCWTLFVVGQLDTVRDGNIDETPA